jgi:hypothetical protein
VLRLVLHAGYRASYALERAGGALSNKDSHGHAVDTWVLAYADKVDAEPIVRGGCKQQGKPVRGGCKQQAKRELGEAHQVRKLSHYTGRTWCFDMRSAPDKNDGFVVVRRATRELKSDYDARSHKQVVDARGELDKMRQADGVKPLGTVDVKRAWVVTHASVPTIQGS